MIAAVLLLAVLRAPIRADEARPAPVGKPNIVFILVDDAGIGDFSAYGCRYGVTPNIDRLAAEGMKFNKAYSGSALCSPSRCSLMTGLHSGHAYIRDNWMNLGKLLPMASDTVTVARLLHDAGYVTGGFGKWGLGNPGTTGVPEKQGFDEFFGYYNQGHAHNYYTDHLLRNGTNVPIKQDGTHTWENYSATRITDETLKFIETNKGKPFFCYATWTLPHLDFVIPSNAPYSDKPWPETVKNYAAMIALIDKDVGLVMQKIKELGIDDKTLVIFSSDNGANQEFIELLGSTGGLRGGKDLLYEGGIRTPFIARWPGKIPPGSSSDQLTSFPDFLPTACEVAGVPIPSRLDGISMLPTLLGKEQLKSHDRLYFELYFDHYDPFFQQAVIWNGWKGYRHGITNPMELYNLKSDPTEKTNIASEHPEIVESIERIMKKEHDDSPYYRVDGNYANGKPKQGYKEAILDFLKSKYNLLSNL